jgi:hypothetical protein
MGATKTQSVVTVKLEYPVQLADRVLTEVTMRRPTVGDVMDNPLKGVEDVRGEVKLLSVVCGLNQEDMRMLDFADYTRLQQQFLFFRGDAGT